MKSYGTKKMMNFVKFLSLLVSHADNEATIPVKDTLSLQGIALMRKQVIDSLRE